MDVDRFWDTTLDLGKEDLTQATSVTVFETPKEPFPSENRKPMEELLVCQVQVYILFITKLDIFDRGLVYLVITEYIGETDLQRGCSSSYSIMN